MPRTITIEDADTGVTITIVIGMSHDNLPVIRFISLAGDAARGIRADDLLLLESFGLRLPAAAPAPRAVQHVEITEPKPEPSSDDTAEPAAPKRPGRAYRKAPPDKELAATYRKFKYDAAQLAERYGVPRKTIWSWLSRLRRNGVLRADEYPQTAQPKGDA